ncbi:MAG: mitochondrial 2-enoyl thioester reductase [Vezdaea aestivalis]|nr:MAG: mitochondrial 2-enoyl thioester reductase [Vezdaea aestivalis]
MILRQRQLRSFSIPYNLFASYQKRLISVYGYIQAKALVYSKYGPPGEQLTLHNYSIPPAYGSSVTIRYLASPINPADINQVQGTYKALPPFTSTLGTSTPSAVPGNEGVAEVVSVGSKVQSLKKGDWVIPKGTGLGTWRTHDQLEESRVAKVDGDGLTSEQVATVNINPCTAYRLLKGFVKLEKGDWWIQNGANSAVGRAAIQLGKLWGFKSINIIRNRPDKELSALKSELEGLGATQIMTDIEFEEKGSRARITDMTLGALPQLALNCTGGRLGSRMLSSLRNGGVHVTYGNMSKKPLRVSAGLLIFSDIRLRGFWVSQWAEANPDAKAQMVKDLLEMMKEGSLKTSEMKTVEWSYETKQGALVDAVVDYEKGGEKPMFLFKE